MEGQAEDSERTVSDVVGLNHSSGGRGAGELQARRVAGEGYKCQTLQCVDELGSLLREGGKKEVGVR